MDDTAVSHGRLVFLGGEAGVGKTAVVRALVESAAGRATVRVGQCDNAAASAALGPLLDALPETAEDMEADVERPAPVPQAPAAAGRDADPAGRSRTCTGPTRPRSTSFASSAGAWTGMPLLVVVTYRDDEVLPGHQLAVVLGDLSSSPAVEQVERHPAVGRGGARAGSGRRVAARRCRPARAHRRQRLLRHRGAGCRGRHRARRRFATRCSPVPRGCRTTRGPCSPLQPCSASPRTSRSSSPSPAGRRPPSTSASRPGSWSATA